MKYFFLLLSLIVLDLAIPRFFPPRHNPAPKILSITPTITPSPTPIRKMLLIRGVPFTSQAPNYDWKDPRLQDGCEETSIIMAYYWANNKTLSPESALHEILTLVNYQKDKFGEYRDTSLQDTADRLLKGYYAYSNFRILRNISLPQIIDEIYQNNLVILPMNGQLLHNPNYTGAGPERHMLLLNGYDPQTREFITQDAGTWRGKDYRYSEDVLYSAIRDYETGYHIPITSIQKNALVISRSTAD